MEIDTTEYVLSHGHEPRGRGSWAFAATPSPPADSKEIFWSGSVTYTEACMLACKHFKTQGVDCIWVQP